MKPGALRGVTHRSDHTRALSLSPRRGTETDKTNENPGNRMLSHDPPPLKLRLQTC